MAFESLITCAALVIVQDFAPNIPQKALLTNFQIRLIYGNCMKSLQVSIHKIPEVLTVLILL